MSRRRLMALVIVVIALTASVGTYIHDNPSGITPISDINTGKVAVGENVTIKAKILQIIIYWDGWDFGEFLVTDGSGHISLSWRWSSFHIGQMIVARGTVGSSFYLQPTEWVEHVWLFA